jgi:hypothetical protein
MLHNDLSQCCHCEVEKYVAELFWREEQQVLLRGRDLGHAPITEILFYVHDEDHIAKLKAEICRALLAVTWHEKHAPPWAVPLLVSRSELDLFDNEEDARWQLRRCFGDSLRNLGYNFWVHPIFPVYAAGAIAHPHAPPAIREDPSLRLEFPPVPLAGLDWGLYWRTPEMIDECWREIARLPAHWRANGIDETEEELIFLAEQHAKLDSISR